MNQRYISNELSHFVGKHCLKDIDKQYQILKTILTEGRIACDPDEPHFEGIRSMGLFGYLGGDLASNTMYVPKMVCFCDIPVGDLAIHTEKYGLCGLSFTKAFLAKKDTAPIFYITTQAAAKLNQPARDFEILYDLLNKYRNELPTELLAYVKPNSPNSSSRLHWMKFVFHFYLLSYIQAFDYTLSDGHERNYYFEREWRSLYDVEFTLSDVVRIFVPSTMSKQLRIDFPEYCGQITFTDESA